MSDSTPETATNSPANLPDGSAAPASQALPQPPLTIALEAGALTVESPSSAPLPPTPQHHPIPNWLRQIERVLRVLVRLYLGLLVCFAPWYPQAWDDNPLFSQPLALHHIITLGAVRGIVSGLGLLNLWIALSESLHSSSEQES